MVCSPPNFHPGNRRVNPNPSPFPPNDHEVSHFLFKYYKFLDLCTFLVDRISSSVFLAVSLENFGRASGNAARNLY